jgi:lactate dehydrogenase-like 2-hydroxyacid dehydrogenase
LSTPKQNLQLKSPRHLGPAYLTTHIGSAVEKVRFEIAMEAAINITQGLTGKIPQ